MKLWCVFTYTVLWGSNIVAKSMHHCRQQRLRCSYSDGSINPKKQVDRKNEPKPNSCVQAQRLGRSIGFDFKELLTSQGDMENLTSWTCWVWDLGANTPVSGMRRQVDCRCEVSWASRFGHNNQNLHISSKRLVRFDHRFKCEVATLQLP